MLKELISLANSLDERGFKKEADLLDRIIKKADEAGEMIFPEAPLGDDAGAPILPEKPDDVVGPAIMPVKFSTYEEILMDMIIDIAEYAAKVKLKKKEGEEVTQREAMPWIEKLISKNDEDIIELYKDLINRQKDEGALQEMYNKLQSLFEANKEARRVDVEEFYEAPTGLFGPLEMAEASSVINSLIKLSNHLDSLGQYKEADFLDTVIKNAKKKKKPSKKQLEALDKNKNGKIDSEDFELLRKKKTKKKK